MIQIKKVDNLSTEKLSLEDKNKIKTLLTNDDYQGFINFYNSLTSKNYEVIDITNINKCQREIKLCVMCYKYDKIRSKFVNLVMNNKMHRDVYIFTFNKFKDTFPKDLNKNNNIKLICSDDNLIGDISDSRNILRKYAEEQNWNDIFIVEDDVYDLILNYGYTSNGNFLNDKISLKTNIDVYFDIWETIIKDKNLLASGPRSWMSNRFIRTDDVIYYGASIAQIIHLNINKTKNLKNRKDTFDDFDFNLQMMKNGIIPYFITCLTFSVATMNDGKSTHGSKLYERQKLYTNNLVKYWGPKLIRTEIKNGLDNCRPNNALINKNLKLGMKIENIIKQYKIQNSNLEIW